MTSRVGAAIAVSALLTTCSGPANKAVGIRLVTRGVIEIQFLRCAGPVVSVELARVVGASSDEENDLVLWRVTANTPQVMTFVRPGTTPRGFTEVVPLRYELRPRDTYAVRIRSDDFSYFSGFRLKDLHTDRILNGWGELLVQQEFLAQAGEVCGFSSREANESDVTLISLARSFVLIPIALLICLGLLVGGSALLSLRRADRQANDN
jgi:hypothetical protein